MTIDSALAARADGLGIEYRYVDNLGARRDAPAATVRALVQDLSAGAAAAQSALPPVAVMAEGDSSPSVPVLMSRSCAAAEIAWSLVTEGGVRLHGRASLCELPVETDPDGQSTDHERRHLGLPSGLPPGYHALAISPAPGLPDGATCRVIVAPRKAYLPPRLEQAGRAWGISVQLYALRSRRNWGIGDFTDLAAIIGEAARAGAALIGINPLHALFLDDPEYASPYAPNSRLFINPLYLDVETVDGFDACQDAKAYIATTEFQARLASLRATELVDYSGVAAAKLPVLGRLFECFRRGRSVNPDDPQAADFRAFQTDRGPALRRFAAFCVERQALPDDAAILRDMEFHEYLQWQSDRQLSRCAQAGRASGMAVGLYQDLAIGADAASAENRSARDALLEGWSIGAPPDRYNARGQSWGSTPINPNKLRASGYESFIELLRANMRHAGALRIDHVLGFNRLFLVPRTASPVAGTYLRFPFEDLMAIIKLESHRHRCLVIGEDLGTVPAGFSARLQAGGVLSCRLLYFERDKDGRFRPPDAYPREAVVAVSTHDGPPLAGFWCGADIDERARLGLYPTPAEADRQRRERERSRAQLASALAAAGLAADSGAAEPPTLSVHRYLARSPARLLMLNFEDLLGVREQINIPGTVTEHPNWRRKLPLDIDSLFAAPEVQRVMAGVRAERGP